MGMRKTIRYRTKGKFYIGVKGTSMEDADEKSASLGRKVLDLIQKMI